MTVFGIGMLLGAVAASAGWWIYVRGLKGVISDLNNTKNVVQAVPTTVADAVKKL